MGVVSMKKWKEEKSSVADCQVCGDRLRSGSERDHGICAFCEGELFEEKRKSRSEEAVKEQPKASIPQDNDYTPFIFTEKVDKLIEKCSPWVIIFAVVYLVAQIFRSLVMGWL